MLSPGSILQGRYQIISLIGRGGMGAVYEALDLRLRAAVAIKETFVLEEEHRRAFEREARLLANLRHPVLPRVIDHFVASEGQFLVMEYIEGDDLAEMVRRRGAPFPIGEVLGWADRLLDALDYLHTRQPPVLHRDVKPANIKLTGDGDLYLLDFGLAKGATGRMESTTAVSVVGFTPQYAPPEQVTSGGTDARSDLYSLAATLYHLLTATVPPDALTRAMQGLRGSPDPLVPVHDLCPAVPRAVSDVLTRALAVRIEERFGSAAEMSRALRKAVGDLHALPEHNFPTVTARRPPTLAAPAVDDAPPTLIEKGKREPLRLLARLGAALHRAFSSAVPAEEAQEVTPAEQVAEVEEVEEVEVTAEEPSPPTPPNEASTRPHAPGPSAHEMPAHERTVVVDHHTVHMRPEEREPAPAGAHTILVKRREVFRQDGDQLFEELILHRDYERLWRSLIHAGGGRNLLTGYGPFGGTSLIRCAIAKARIEIERAERGTGALLALYFQVSKETREGFEIEVANVGFSHTPGAGGVAANTDLQELKVRAGKAAEEASNTVFNFPLDARRGGDFFAPPTVMPAAEARGGAYDFSQLVADLNSFFKQKKRDKALRQIVQRLTHSADLRSRVIFIVDRVRHLETIEALAGSELFNDRGVRVIAVARKEDFDGWQDARRRLRELDFSKWYVPSLWEIDWRSSLFDGAAPRAPEFEPHYETFIAHLRFKGRGSLGNIIRELGKPTNMHFGRENSYLDVASLTARAEVQHNAWLQRVLDLNWRAILGDLFGGIDQDERTDRARVGVYALLDWLAHENRFRRGEMFEEARRARVTISDDGETLAEAVDNLLHVLVGSKYLSASGDSYRVVWDMGRQPRPIRVRPRWAPPMRARATRTDDTQTATRPQPQPADVREDTTPDVSVGPPPGVEEPDAGLLVLPPDFKKVSFRHAPGAGFSSAPSRPERAQAQAPTPPASAPPRQEASGPPATAPPPRRAPCKIFVSYSREDEDWRRRLHLHLKPLEHEGLIELWDDTKLRAGERWGEEIRRAISLSRIAILLVSAYFLASDFIIKHELPLLLEASESGKMQLIPIVVSQCTLTPRHGLSQLQTANDPQRPLSSMTRNSQDVIFVQVAKRIEKALDS